MGRRHDCSLCGQKYMQKKKWYIEIFVGLSTWEENMDYCSFCGQEYMGGKHDTQEYIGRKHGNITYLIKIYRNRHGVTRTLLYPRTTKL
jgi:hypothetical protein